MSDTATSGDTAPVAPAETVGATPAPAQPAAPEQAAAATPAPAFGSSRGSGLARGKRASNTAATTKNAASTGGYKPTAIQIVTTAREYKNPFAPAEEQPAAPEAAQDPAPAAPVQETPAPAQPSTEPVPQASETPDAAATEEPKAELNILPPEDKPRRAQSWQSDSFAPGQKERPTFQPRGNSDRPERGQRRERRDGSQQTGAPSQPAPQHTPAPAPEKKKSAGLFGWIKGLFGGSDEPQAPATGDDRNERRNRDGGRRHRGGRNRGQRGEYRGNEPRGASSSGEYHSHGGGERRFDRGDRGDRGRHRGRRNRQRNDGGGNRGNPGGSETAQ